ncbi:MAG: excinuclease ABC subunit UvrC [Alphaproteobacteria bacterium]|nr:excinuclease ABC subunit UvrC [Alphaproteobacteria bacterium]
MSAKDGLKILKAKVALLPLRSGVYRMLDKNGKVLYVGKAKSLKKRVSSYTHFEKLPTRLQRMVSEVADLIVVETASEAEAFLLENELIKRYQPYYNILLKDDKSFPYIMFSDFSNTAFPRVSKYRGVRHNNASYFGPYASVQAVDETLDVMQKVFGLRTCSDTNYVHRSRPCLLYQIKRCTGPCVGLISQNEYQSQLQAAKDFLMGKNVEVQKQLSALMKEKSDAMEYEEAMILRDKIAALNKIQSGMDGQISTSLDADFLALFRQDNVACIQIFFFRNGQNGGTHSVFLNNLHQEENSEVLSTFLGQFYADVSIPHEIILSEMPLDKSSIEKAFSEKSGHIVKLVSSVRGVRQKMLDRAKINAQESLIRYGQETGLQKSMLKELASLMGIEKINRVEVYDNSHIQGTSSVGVCVCADETGFVKSGYKRFNINTAQTNDDFDMMREVLLRRLKRGTLEKNLPDAFIIDGGIGQLSSVRQVMEQTGVYIPTLGVAKGVDRNAGNERLFLMSNNNPIILEHDSPLLHFIQRLRDEAHRFAIGTHRNKRSKNMKKNALDKIEGVGTYRRKNLLEYFGSPNAIASAGINELLQVEGINEKIAKNIYTFFHK